MTDEKTPFHAGEAAETESGEDDSFVPSGDGMSTATARVAISASLRKKIMQDYDLLELINKAHYYIARAHSKDGMWAYELLVDKQTGEVRVINQKEISRKR